MSLFSQGMDAANDSMELVMGESFIVDGVSYPAVDIGELTESLRAMIGGQFKDGTLTLLVRYTVFLHAGIKEFTPLTVNGAALRVDKIINDGDNSRLLVCGPAAVKTPRL